MSHNSYRMPARLRVAHAAQLAKQRPPGTPEPPPGPSGKARLKKYRKRAKFLSAMRKIRARGEGRLETHIWHAKRFSMTRIGGCLVADRCNDRGYRSAYRAVAHACVAHDASYLTIIELAGSTEELKKALRAVLSDFDARRGTTDPVTQGRRVVREVVLQDSTKDEEAIAPVDLLWRPDAQAVWLFLRPETVSDVGQLMQSQSVYKGVVTDKPLIYSMYGPRSGAILGAVLGDINPSCGFARANSPACLPASSVAVGIASDPRTTFPPKTVSQYVQGGDVDPTVFSTLEVSDLWHAESRHAIRERGMSGTVGGEVPFMVLQRCYDGAFASGWDIILPAGWGIHFWVSFMYANNARVVGQTEIRMLSVETGAAIFPEDHIDCVAGAKELRQEEKNLKEIYDRKPPGKRVNYVLNRVISPMYPDLAKVAEAEMGIFERPSKKGKVEGDIANPAQGYLRVARGDRLRSLLGDVYARLSYERGDWRMRKQVRNGVSNGDTEPVALTTAHCTSFARVRVTPAGKGVPEKNAMLCMPTPKEQLLISNGGWGGFREVRAVLKKGEDGRRPTRELVGYVTVGGVALSVGGGIGRGLVAISALRRMQCGKLGACVLVRNVDSLHYRPAWLRLA